MTNPHGTPIWYELMTADPDAAKRFYDPLVGWTIGAAPPGGMDYRMIAAADGQVGGVMRITPEMEAGGAKPGWLMYVGVDDVDATAEKAKELGATIMVPPTDIPDVGRFAFLADPQGAPFYVMRGNSPESSTAFSPGALGRCSWNELWTSDAAGAIAFYGALFGWENRETMDMGPMGGYHFLDLGPVRLGALAQSQQAGQQTRWNPYFTVRNVDAAVDRVKASGGAVTMGPHDVPGDSRIIMGTDPEGATFALVSGAGHAGEQQ